MSTIGVIRFPGTNNELETKRSLERLGAQAKIIPHFKPELVREVAALYLPGGFSYGDYLRPGAVAKTTEIGIEIVRAADEGKPILGVCNGFQVLTELGLLPGALVKNTSTRFIAKWISIWIERSNSYLEDLAGTTLSLPIAHYSGSYYQTKDALEQMKQKQQIVARYSLTSGDVTPHANPNGSLENIAGIANKVGNVIGLMPHPERAIEPFHRTQHGKQIIASFLEAIK